MIRWIVVGDKQPFTLRVNHIASGVLPLWEGKSGRKRSGRHERVDLADSVALLSVCCNLGRPKVLQKSARARLAPVLGMNFTVEI